MSSPVPQPLQEWLRAALPERGPFEWEELTAGTSNVTYRLDDGAGALVLQRPPSVALDGSAHNVERQYRLLRALRDHPVPTPRTIGLCADTDVLGVPFFVVEFVAGVTITDTLPPGAPPPGEAARQIGFAMIDALVAIHAVDWRASGLEGFGRPEGFLERQVPRWSRHYESVRTRELPLFEPLGEWLEERRPADLPPTVMHGDFHLANCLIEFDPQARVGAVIDWEMATIGDPLMDLGAMLAFWGSERPSPPAIPNLQAISRVDGAPTRGELAERYARASGRSIEAFDYYLVLSGWKLAAIMESAFSNFSKGLTADPFALQMEHNVPQLLSEAALVAGLPAPRR